VDERDAARAAEAVSESRPLPSFLARDAPAVLARQAVPAVRPPMPARPPLRVIPGGRTGPGGQPLQTPEGPRYAPDPFDTSAEAAFARAAEIQTRERRIWELERPKVTLARGGKPPDFITVEGRDSEIGSYGQIFYQRRAFHILSAIEYEVGRANNEADLRRIRRKYMPEIGVPVDPALPGIVFLPLWEVDFPPDLDPGGSARMEAYANAVELRSLTIPELQKALALSPETEKRRKYPGAYPICWAEQLLPPTRSFFIRTEAERDEWMAKQASMQKRWRASIDPDFDDKQFHVHHVNPLFLGGADNLQSNGIYLFWLTHLRGHEVLRYQPQLLVPPIPLLPLGPDLYRHPPGTPYEVVGFKKEAHQTC
jgi:hypothetical protein